MQDAVSDWQKKLYNNMNVTEQYLATSNIIREQDNVNAIYFNCVERAIKALFLINSGGIITALTYIPHSKGLPAHISLSAALVIFLIGLFLVSVVVAYDYHWAQKKSLEFYNDIKQFLVRKTSFESIRRFQIEQKPDKYLGLVTKMGWGSACCAFSGVLFGLLAYFLS